MANSDPSRPLGLRAATALPAPQRSLAVMDSDDLGCTQTGHFLMAVRAAYRAESGHFERICPTGIQRPTWVSVHTDQRRSSGRLVSYMRSSRASRISSPSVCWRKAAQTAVPGRGEQFTSAGYAVEVLANYWRIEQNPPIVSNQGRDFHQRVFGCLQSIGLHRYPGSRDNLYTIYQRQLVCDHHDLAHKRR